MFEGLLFNFGYLGLFIASFLSSTILPLASEGFLALMLTLKFNFWLIIFFSVLGGYLGSLTNYLIGLKGGEYLVEKRLKIKREKMKKVEKLYEKWGAPILFFSWVPFIGDPLTIVPGILRLKLTYFSFWIIFGKIVHAYIFAQATLLVL